jgi:polysaccharide biosynthesis protein PslG
LTEDSEVLLRGQRSFLRFLLVVGLLLTLAGEAWLGLSYAQSRGKPTPPPVVERSTAHTDVSPWGANFFLSREVETWKREKTVQMAREAGIRWAKQQFSWEEIEPARKGEFRDIRTGDESWKKFDDIVDLLRRNGMEIIARIDRPPDWSRKDNTLKERPPDNLADYGDFIYEFVSHYRGRVRYIQVWNEPNIYPEWGDRPVDPAAYVDMLRIAYLRAKEADPNIVVLSAPLAITLGEPHPTPGKWRSMSDLQFLEEVYRAGAKDYFDILSANAFGMDAAPEAAPSPTVLNLRRVELQRAIMEKYGDGSKAVWFNEYGWNAAPVSMPTSALTWKRVDEDLQAEYTVRGVDWARKNWPWAGVFCMWYFRQVGQYTPDDAAYYFRVVDVDFTPRSLYYAVKDANARTEPPGPGAYEETNQAVVADESWTQVGAPRVGGGSYLESDVAGAAISFPFRGNALDLNTHVSPTGGRLLVTLDGHSAPGLPKDASGRSFVDLYGAVDWWGTVHVVRGAADGAHTVRLTVSNTADPASRGRVCAVDTFIVLSGVEAGFPWARAGVLAAALLAFIALLTRRPRRPDKHQPKAATPDPGL